MDGWMDLLVLTDAGVVEVHTKTRAYEAGGITPRFRSLPTCSAKQFPMPRSDHGGCERGWGVGCAFLG